MIIIWEDRRSDTPTDELRATTSLFKQNSLEDPEEEEGSSLFKRNSLEEADDGSSSSEDEFLSDKAKNWKRIFRQKSKNLDESMMDDIDRSTNRSIAEDFVDDLGGSRHSYIS